MIRLAIDASNFVRDRRGMGRVARAITQAALSDSGIETTFLLPDRRDARALQELFTGASLTVNQYASASQRGRYDVVWFPWNGMRFSAGPPSVLTLNDAFAFTHPAKGRIARAREQKPIRSGARKGTVIVTPSHWSRNEIERTLSVAEGRIRVIPYAPDPFFYPANGSCSNLNRYVLMVGALEARKNAALVIDACAAAFSDPGEMLIVVGGLAPEDLRRSNRLSLSLAVLQDPSDEQLRSLYRNARVVAVPSTAEGFGLVAVEAMACGTATIASNASALPESTQGGALLLDPHDAKAWEDAIARVLRDDAFAIALAARGAARFAFSDRSAPARGYLRLFADLVNDGAKPMHETLR